jgi:hypothetical protein
MINLTSRAIMNTARVPALADLNVMKTFQILLHSLLFHVEIFGPKVYHVDAPLQYALSHCPSCYDVLHGGIIHGEHDVAPEAF